MSWFSSLKEKSLKIAQLYKNELSEFMSNLNDDIKGIAKPESNAEENIETHKADNIKGKCLPAVDIVISVPNSTTLLNVLQSLIPQKISDEELQAKVSIVLSNPEEYLQADPNNLLLFHRDDFTSFQDFMKRDILTYDICQGVVNSNNQLSLLFRSITDPEATKLLLSRFMYSLIYLIENSPQPKAGDLDVEKTTPGKDALIENQGDALEKNSQTSEIVVEDGSSSSNHSNETEKIESTGQRDANSESDDWQIEEKSFSIEFTN